MCIAAVIVLAAHWPSLSSTAFSFDDDQYLFENQLVQNPGWESARRFLCEVLHPSSVRGYYQPLAMLSLMADYAMGGRLDNLRPFHITSLTLHLANTLLIIVFLYLLFGNSLAAVTVGLLFGVHPLTIESIPWLSERKTLLAAFFVLWCLIFYVRFSRTQSWQSYLLSMVFFILALMSKPSSTPVPLLMILLDYWPLNRLSKKTIIRKIPFFVVAVIAAIITFLSQKNTSSVTMPAEHGLVHILLIICHNIVFYLQRFTWPVGLSGYYPFPSPFALSHPNVLAGVIGTAVLSVILLVSLRWTRSLVTGWLFFFLAIFPTLGVIGFHPVIAADRHAYIPIMGLFLPLCGAVAWLCRGWTEKLSRRCIVALAVIACLAAAEITATRSYLVHWRDSVSLHRYMIKLAPNVTVLHNNLGNFLDERGETEEAIEHFNKSLEINPYSPEVHNNLGNVLHNVGRSDDAIEHFRKALELRPKFSQIHYNLARVLATQGKNDEAISEYRLALQTRPRNVDILSNLAYLLAEQERYEEAVQLYEKALEVKPDDIIVHGRLGLALAGLGKNDEAIKQFKKVLAARPADVEMFCNVGILLEQQGKLAEAIVQYRRALEIQPDYTKAKDLLHDALEKPKR